MNDRDRVHASKFLSLVLRHRPEEIGVALDPNGWIGVDALLGGLAKHGRPLTLGELREIIATSDKKRFAFSDDGLRVRASQGHSLEVDLGYEPATPPDVLFHGTARKNLASIKERGLLRGRRHHVHLSSDEETARKVGARHGEPVVLRVDAAAMAAAGRLFFRSANGVWLTEAAPPEFLLFP